MSSKAFDFYTNINKKWLTSSKIPDNDTSFSVFDILEKRIQHDIINVIKTNKKTDSRFGDFVKSIYTGRTKDIEYLNNFINSININSSEDLFATFGLLNLCGLRSPISFDVSNDSRNTEKYAVFLSEPQLSLIKEEYKSSSELYKKYGVFLSDLAAAIGDKTLGPDFLKMETELSKTYYDYEDNFVVEKTYNPMTYKQLCHAYPLLKDFLSVLGLSLDSVNIIVVNPQYLKTVYGFIKTLGFKEWTRLLKMYVYISVLEVLPEPFETLHFNFLYKYMLGQKMRKSVDIKAFEICNSICEDTIGFLYTEGDLEKFTKIKAQATELLQMVMKSAKKSVEKLTWLSESSRKIAIFKLDKMKSQIAFPEKWTNEFNCAIDKNCFMKNLFNLNRLDALYNIERLTLKEPLLSWDNSCYDVNAFYYTELNLLCIPIGFLNPPFFSLEQSFVQNLAGLGNIMSHEMAHGFDEEGRKYDEKGNYKPWWVSIDIEMYGNKTRKLIEVFSKEKYFGLQVNGELTLGENLADFGAMAICLEVLKGYYTKENRTEVLREFFNWYAKTWIYKETKEKRTQAIKKDRHAPPQIRVNIVVRHFQEFYDAFSIGEKDAGWIAPSERINIWG